MHYKGKSIHDVLEMTVEEALAFFSPLPRLKRKLQTLYDVGLGYVKLGQPSTQLSGGEAQRVKLATELSRRDTGRTLYVLGRATTGLHVDDVKRLLEILQRLCDGGSSVLVIEHNLDVIKCADYVIDLGPEGGELGGTLVTAGTPEQVGRLREELYRPIPAKGVERANDEIPHPSCCALPCAASPRHSSASICSSGTASSACAAMQGAAGRGAGARAGHGGGVVPVHFNLGVILPAFFGVPLDRARVPAAAHAPRLPAVSQVVHAGCYGRRPLHLLVCGILMTNAAHRGDHREADAVIVLGAAVHGDRVTWVLSNRLDAAIDYLEAHPDAIAVVSGGQGPGETVTEGSAMRKYMIEHGIDESRVYAEERATNTGETSAIRWRSCATCWGRTRTSRS